MNLNVFILILAFQALILMNMKMPPWLLRLGLLEGSSLAVLAVVRSVLRLKAELLFFQSERWFAAS